MASCRCRHDDVEHRGSSVRASGRRGEDKARGKVFPERVEAVRRSAERHHDICRAPADRNPELIIERGQCYIILHAKSFRLLGRR